jgi:hypothetical protein
MKRRTSIYHRTFAFAYVLLVAVIFCGCETPSGQRYKKDGYSIVEIDSCEYIEVSSMTGANNGYYSLTHKGNCKFCAERSKK